MLKMSKTRKSIQETRVFFSKGNVAPARHFSFSFVPEKNEEMKIIL